MFFFPVCLQNSLSLLTVPSDSLIRRPAYGLSVGRWIKSIPSSRPAPGRTMARFIFSGIAYSHSLFQAFL